GLPLSRQTISNWMLSSTTSWLKPFYEELYRRIRQEEVLHADETTLQVLEEPGKKAESKSYMWLYRTGR
ncbi:transposase, partial [Chryseomicrobium imtechense]